MEPTTEKDGLLRVKSGNQWLEASKERPVPKMLFDQFWHEGEIAILAHTSNAIGTPSDLLATAIQKRFGPQGVDCRYRSYRSVQELRQGAPAITLAVIRFSLFVDHYVAVLHVDETRVVVGDPAKGLRAYTIGDFERIWKHTGVQIQRGHAPTTSQPGAKSL